MYPAKLIVSGALCMVLSSCTTYRVHLKVLPEDTYKVLLDDEDGRCTTNGAGEKDISFKRVSIAPSPKISVTNKIYSGYVVLDGNASMRDARNLDSLGFVKSPDGERIYDLRFVFTSRMNSERNNGNLAAPAPVETNAARAPAETKAAPSLASSDEEVTEPAAPKINSGRMHSHGINDNPQYARKIATTGATCFFVGMGLNYATAFIPVGNSDGSVNGGGLIISLVMSVASGPLQIAGTSWAAGGAKLAWELGEGKCEPSKEPFTLWGPYKGGWVFTALGGAFSVISNLVSSSDRGAAMTLSIISLGMGIGRDVCWSITNVKALSMTRKVKECLEEQPTPTHRMRLELEPYATRGGAGARCSLLF